MSEDQGNTDDVVSTAFGAANRARLLKAYFASSVGGPVTADTAWVHIYRLLLWTDQTTGLAHCYESDKSQPGKRWYARSLAFHDWLSNAFGTTPADLAREIDWMFQRAARELAAEVVRNAARLSVVAERQATPYNGRGFPSPGEDPRLISMIRDALGSHMTGEPSAAAWGVLVQRIRQYLSLDNKRKNLLGEGFEDALGEVIERSCAAGSGPTVHVRANLKDLPGFANQRAGGKTNKVDLALTRAKMRTIVTAKWSVRADREKQFTADYAEYVQAESDRKPFEYVFVTNEFDPARLVRACENLSGHSHMFASVVHISTDSVRATYGDVTTGKLKAQDATMRKVLEYMDSGRLISLHAWLKSLRS